jgi:DNA-binding NarL/FixJ family response regulator
MEQITVLIVDDHPLYRGGTRAALEEADDITVVDAVGTARAAKERVAELGPDIMLLDINLPDESGIDVAREIRVSHPETGIIALTAYDDDAYILALARSGVRGYLLKTATDAEIVSAVRAVALGGSVFAAAVTEALLRHTRDEPSRDGQEFGLTEREQQVLMYAAQGLSNREIGTRLGISERTAQAHLSHVYEKLRVKSRTQAISKALQEGLIKVPEVES